MRTRDQLGLLLLVTLAASAVAVAAATETRDDRAARPAERSAATQADGEPAAGAAAQTARQQVNRPLFKEKFITDFTEPRRVVGYQDDVFVATNARKLDKKARVPKGSIPRELYEVRVREVVKGDVRGSVVVAHIGGNDPDTKEPIAFANAPPLAADKTYLLATTSRTGYEPLVLPVFGQIEIDSNEEYERLLARYRAAARSPIGPSERKK